MTESPAPQVLSQTESLCPVCLARIPAQRVAWGDDVYLEKSCSRHGRFRTVIWRGSPPFRSWVRPKIPVQPPVCFTAVDAGCPFDCGLCSAHRQITCTALLEITQRCNLGCPVCFAAAGTASQADPDLETIGQWFARVRAAAAGCNIQFSGGEPTVREDLPAVIDLGRRMGFEFIQLNTNGIRLAAEAGYAGRLGAAGLASVFLQFDGVDEDVYRALRGRPLFEEKRLAVEHCAAAGIGVVLVPTVVPGTNDHQLGAIVNFALQRAPAVRGVHFQPVSYFGRHPAQPHNRHRITLPEIMTALVRQSDGRIHPDDFRPPGCENALCSFNARYLALPGGQLKPLVAASLERCCSSRPEPADVGARRAVSAVARQWRAPLRPQTAPISPRQEGAVNDLDKFLELARSRTFSLSGMAFQDAWTLDLGRLRDCCIHTVSPDGRLIPFCAYNLTAAGGRALYRGR